MKWNVQSIHDGRRHTYIQHTYPIAFALPIYNHSLLAVFCFCAFFFSVFVLVSGLFCLCWGREGGCTTFFFILFTFLFPVNPGKEKSREVPFLGPHILSSSLFAFSFFWFGFAFSCVFSLFLFYFLLFSFSFLETKRKEFLKSREWNIVEAFKRLQTFENKHVWKEKNTCSLYLFFSFFICFRYKFSS